MIRITMKPVKAPMVRHEGLYVATFNDADIGLRIRARKASHAEEKLMEVFKKSVRDKSDESGFMVIDFNLEKYKGEKDDQT